MVVVAIAGGGSGVGSNIVNAILSDRKHTLVVLSRSKQPDLTSRGVDVRVVDYGSVEGLKVALTKVHTVISCISGYGAVPLTSQLALLQAAKQTGVVRFAPSDWALDCYDAVEAYADKEAVWEAVRESGLEYTRFINGFWMNVWGPGAPRDETDARSGYQGPPFALDLQAGTLVVPGDGSQKVVSTTMQDIGRFVASSLNLPAWEPDSRIVGDKMSCNEIPHLVKKVTGRKLEIKHISVKDSEAVIAGETDFFTKFYHQLLFAIAHGRMDFNATLNQRLPEIRPVTVEEYLRKYWVPD